MLFPAPVVSSVPALLRDHAATHRQVALDDDSFLALQHHVALYEGLMSVAVQSQANLLLDADETKGGGGASEQKAGGGDDSGEGAGGAAGASSPGTVALATPRWMGQTTKAVNARKFSFTRILAPARAAENDEAYRAELYMTVHACMYPEMDTIDAIHQLVRTARRACGADVARLFILSWPDEDAEKDNDDGGGGARSPTGEPWRRAVFSAAYYYAGCRRDPGDGGGDKLSGAGLSGASPSRSKSESYSQLLSEHALM